MAIEQFRDEYFPFSNMYPLEYDILADSGAGVRMWVPTSEHLYMAERFEHPLTRIKVAHKRADKGDKTPYGDALAAKRLAHYLIAQGAKESVHTEAERIALMRRAVKEKLLRNHGIMYLLLNTGDEEIVEGNSHGDRFWGVDPIGSDNGENHLGKILMDLRQEFRHE